jgi:hypothetical protein
MVSLREIKRCSLMGRIFSSQLVNQWYLEGVAVHWRFCHSTLFIMSMFWCGCTGESASGVLEEGAKEFSSPLLDNRNYVSHFIRAFILKIFLSYWIPSEQNPGTHIVRDQKNEWLKYIQIPIAYLYDENQTKLTVGGSSFTGACQTYTLLIFLQFCILHYLL